GLLQLGSCILDRFDFLLDLSPFRAVVFHRLLQGELFLFQVRLQVDQLRAGTNENLLDLLLLLGRQPDLPRQTRAFPPLSVRKVRRGERCGQNGKQKESDPEPEFHSRSCSTRALSGSGASAFQEPPVPSSARASLATSRRSRSSS